jgi:transposase
MYKTCGLDVHKDTVFCGVFDGKRHQEVKEYSTLTSSITSLGEYLKSEAIEDVALESTGMYWIPVWNILEEMGFNLTLVNPYLIKQMPGRKSDVKDAQWIATLLHKGLVRSSLIPCKEIRELRTYSRKYVRLQQRQTSILQEMERNLEMCGIRITSFVSNISSKSVMKVIHALIDGESDPEVLAGYIHGRIVNKHKRKTIVESLRADMKAFENSGKFAGWTGLRPRNDESAGKFKSTATTKGNRYLRAILVQIAWAASRTKGSFFKEKFTRLCLRKNRKKALIAIARKMAVLIWNVLNYQEAYNPQKLIVYEPGKVQAKMDYHQKEFRRLENLLKN